MERVTVCLPTFDEQTHQLNVRVPSVLHHRAKNESGNVQKPCLAHNEETQTPTLEHQLKEIDGAWAI